MRQEHLKLIVCPECRGELGVRDVRCDEQRRIRSAKLTCLHCAGEYPILKYIPRFVPSDNYANSFGVEWTKHAATQYDSHSGKSISERRFFDETKWSRDLRGQYVLEVGCGSGRFTEHAAATGATVVALDYSNAVEANYARQRDHVNVLIIQADVYRMPLRQDFFDKTFCFGVLQHTPDPRRAFMSLPRHVKAGGDLAVDVYRKLGGVRGLLQTKYWVRPITRRMPPAFLYEAACRYVKLMWPIARLIHRLPHGRQINWALLIADYRDVYDLNDDMLREWAILDTFDMLSPRYDAPQTLENVREWFRVAGLDAVEVEIGYNGIEGRGKK